MRAASLKLSSCRNFRRGREFHVDVTAQPSAQVLGVAIEGGCHLGGLLAPQRLHEHGGVAQVRIHPHLGDGDRHVLKRRIGDLGLGQDLHQSVAGQFAGAELPLTGALGRAFAGWWGVFHQEAFEHPGTRIGRASTGRAGF